ncbi:serine hydrolase [Erythrobacter sp. sf7]|uniref:Serine hydrolase n=1 Tax=Erythrobacter fulvus TaxID=2987523 RepID=A0ABT5JQ27_9SPHN|nr:serine hydrolase domain-containing protein [Erythrobacter fulvus]MDC8754877.1 serine hydrolase [Erythrobacter fulvus]
MRILLAFALAVMANVAFPAMAQQDSATVELASGAQVDAAYLDQALEAAAASQSVSGFSVALVNGNQIVYRRSLGVADRETQVAVSKTTLFEFASMSKPAFGALVVDLASDGIIDLDRPLAEYYPHPDLGADPRAAKITARQVLTHQSGLPNWRTDSPDGKLDIAFEPGTGRRYSGEGYEYLADVLMHILGTDDRGLDAIFRQRFAKPSGAFDTHFVQDADRVRRKATGYAKGKPFSGDIDYANDGFGAAYSIHSTASDYARFMIGIMDGSTLDEDERAIFFAPQGVPIPEDDPERAIGLADQALGYAVYELPIGRVFAHGGNNEGFTGSSAMLPDEGWAFVIVSNENQANDFVLQTMSLVLGLIPLPAP